MSTDARLADDNDGRDAAASGSVDHSRTGTSGRNSSAADESPEEISLTDEHDFTESGVTYTDGPTGERSGAGRVDVTAGGTGDGDVAESPKARGAVSTLDDEERTVGAATKMSFADRVRTTDRVQLLIVCLIGLALVFFVRGLTLGVTGADRYQLRAGIESVLPVPDSVQVSANQSVVVDLDPLSTGVLIIDGVELETVNLLDYPSGPGVQLDLPPVTIFEPGNATLTFTPSRDAAITSFEPGEHTVEVRFWKEADGPQRARSYTWTFRAS